MALRKALEVRSLFAEAQERVGDHGHLVGYQFRRVRQSGRSRAEVAERRARAVDSLRAGATRHEVAAQHGVSPHTVTWWARMAGVRCPDRRAAHHRDARLVEALRSGHTRDSVAERFGVSQHVVRRVAARAGLYLCPPPPPGRDERILADVAAGVPVATVARRYDLAWHGVRSVVWRRTGLTIRALRAAWGRTA